MSKNIAFISGKGGSGKTSLALAYAKALADIELKVLLVDCDMCTHGATFFMRPHIESYRKANSMLLTVDDILSSNTIPPYGFLNTISNKAEHDSTKKTFYNLVDVEKNLYFIPSDISISNDKENKYLFNTFVTFLKEEVSEHFDVIILDCQAGYSDFTRCVLRSSDITLLVTEPDSVSAAANRALCFQLGIELDSVQAYQIFSKVTSDEAIHYSKTSTSSFFANLSPVIFDWELRRTFVYLTIPSAETVNVRFEKNILDTLSILLPEYKELIQSRKTELHTFHMMNLERQLDFLEYKRRKIKRMRFFDNIYNILSIIGLLVSGIAISFFDFNYRMKSIYLIILAITVFITFIVIFKKKYTENMIETDQEILDIKEQISESEFNN